MSNRALVDTQYVVALINRRDQHHGVAVDLARQLRHQSLLVTDAILLEIGSVLARRFRSEAVAIIEQFQAAPDVEIVHLAPSLFERALALYKMHQDKEWSLVDCVSFVVMRDAGMTRALTYDQHFVQAGFQALMREHAIDEG